MSSLLAIFSGRRNLFFSFEKFFLVLFFPSSPIFSFGLETLGKEGVEKLEVNSLRSLLCEKLFEKSQFIVFFQTHSNEKIINLNFDD